MSRRRAGPLRVALFDAYPHVHGGSQQVLLTLAGELATRHVRVEVLTVRSGPFTERLDRAGVPWSAVAFPPALMVYGHQSGRGRSVAAAATMPAAWVRLARRIRANCDVLHVNNLRGILLMGPAARLAKVPVVWHVHQPEPEPLLNRIGATLASAIVVPSVAVLDHMPGVAASAVTAIPVCTPPEALDATTEPGLTPLVVTAGRIMPDKGFDTLIEAMASVRERLPEVRLEVIGGPQEGYEDYATDLARRVADLHLEKVVTFAGFVERPFAHWRDAWVYTQPSRYDTLPLAVLEAMASGLPVVATDVGGMRDLVEDGQTGVLVAPGDAPRLADAIVRLLDDPAEARRMGANGRVRATRDFSAAHMTERTLDLYRRLVH
jgi:glycosyltransferase involved in cell wall biosynthesis